MLYYILKGMIGEELVDVGLFRLPCIKEANALKNHDIPSEVFHAADSSWGSTIGR